jgi:hypothetical protein
MVHKKYIKRGNKTFGPYLYENYREKGITKTKYLGKDALKSSVKEVKFNWKFFLILCGLILFVSVLFLFIFENNLSLEKKIFLKGALGTESPLGVFVRVVGAAPPEIEGIPEEFLVCENTPLSYFFNVSYYNHAINRVSVTVDPVDYFYISLNKQVDENNANYELWSSKLTKDSVNRNRVGNNGWAVYSKTIAASYLDYANSTQLVSTKITVIEVNNPPKFDKIGTKTVWTHGDDSNLSIKLNIPYEETPLDKLNFSLNYKNGSISPFIINALGEINISGNDSLIDPGNTSKVYNLSICVNDTGIQHPHPNISLCWNQGWDSVPLQYCDDFSLTITRENRPPIIVSYSPLNLSENISSTDSLYFNITKKDPDETIPDSYWYSDTNFLKFYRGIDTGDVDTLEYNFGCGISGNHSIKVIVSDGLLNTSLQWNFSISGIACPVQPVSTGGGSSGGGGGGKLSCDEKWGCNEWVQCKNLKNFTGSKDSKWLNSEDTKLIQDRCNSFNYSSYFCGFQVRTCTDFNLCKTNLTKPGILKECYYTDNPNCNDSIKNCHDGHCELLTDCGGPCAPCPTCSDKIKNQEETDIDCGGPCSACPEVPIRPLVFKSIVSYSLIALLAVVLILVFRQIWEYKKFKKIREEKSIRSSIGGVRPLINLFLVLGIVALLFFANIFIMNISKPGALVSNAQFSFLNNYGFMNSFLKGLGSFYLTGPILSNDGSTQIILGSDSDNGAKYSGQNFYFYAQYQHSSDSSSVTGGYCRIRFEDYNHIFSDWFNMPYELNPGSGAFGYSTLLNYKGNYNFEVQCSFDSSFNSANPGFVSATDSFIVTNTPPVFNDAWKTNYYGLEDNLFIYDFSSNASDVDINDNLFFDFQSINLMPISNFPWIILNSSSGIMKINSSTNSQTGIFRVSVKVLDSNNVGELREFNFNIGPVNDAPVFLNLENKSFEKDALFDYTINSYDEENNFPFKLNIDFLNCSNEILRGNCTLFTGMQYTFNEALGTLHINFIPGNMDIGSYLINFSLTDASSLGNKTASKLINFTVNPVIWKSPLHLNLSWNEGETVYLNLSENVSENNMIFSSESGFPSFSLSSQGIISFVPDDQDVGENLIKITARDSSMNSSKIFNFTIYNINDNVSIVKPLNFNGVNMIGSDYFEGFENSPIELILFADDNDFLVSQKNFYNENLTFNFTISGPNSSLFNFVSLGLARPWRTEYRAFFIPRNESLGNYTILLNLSDKSGSSDSYIFNLSLLARAYDTPVINYPFNETEFNFDEGKIYNITFNVSHKVGDNLLYKVYIGGLLNSSFSGSGNGTNLTWQFTPSYDQETYGSKINLSILVSNPLFRELSANQTWNLTINHTNAPPKFISYIGDKILPYTSVFQIDLKDYFYDIDNKDPHYNQSIRFIITSNSSPGYVTVSPVTENWTFVLSSSKFSGYSEKLNITAYDLDENGDNLSSAVSNNFIVEFIEPQKVQVPIPVPQSGSGSTSDKIIALKILVPGQISAYDHERITIPLSLINSGKTAFNDLNLTASLFKNGNTSKDANYSLDKTYFKILAPGQNESFNATIFFNTNIAGNYDLTINVKSRAPIYSDWGKIQINLQKTNESQVREKILFTEEFITENPQCVEINELIKDAKNFMDKGEYGLAMRKSEEAINACKTAISQVSVPLPKSNYFIVSLYLVIAILIAFILGIAYYFFQRKKFETPAVEEEYKKI